MWSIAISYRRLSIFNICNHGYFVFATSYPSLTSDVVQYTIMGVYQWQNLRSRCTSNRIFGHRKRDVENTQFGMRTILFHVQYLAIVVHRRTLSKPHVRQRRVAHPDSNLTPEVGVCVAKLHNNTEKKTRRSLI